MIGTAVIYWLIGSGFLFLGVDKILQLDTSLLVQ